MPFPSTPASATRTPTCPRPVRAASRRIVTSSADPTLLTDRPYTEIQPVTNTSSYSYLLPSLDAKLELTDNLVLRFDASRTLTRPGLNLLTPVLNVGSGQRVGALTASGGNPNLRPYLADNFDLGAEWYYQRNSYLAVNFFLKNVSNFIVGGVTRQAINGVVDPTTGQPASSRCRSRSTAPTPRCAAWSSHGSRCSATAASASRPTPPSSTPTARMTETNISQTGFAVTGLANSANFVGFYDKYGLPVPRRGQLARQVSAAVRSEPEHGSFGAEPTFVNQSFQVDLTHQLRHQQELQRLR